MTKAPDSLKDAGDVKITPEMIEAGMGELLGFYSDDIIDSAEIVVADVYRAMVLAEPQFRP